MEMEMEKRGVLLEEEVGPLDSWAAASPTYGVRISAINYDGHAFAGGSRGEVFFRINQTAAKCK